MNINVDTLKSQLCNTFCRDVGVSLRGENIAISLPMVARDGDRMTAYLSAIEGGWRVSDKGATLMRLSYENDLAKLLSGARAKLFSSILAESGMIEDDGEIYIDVPADSMHKGLFALGQGVTRIEDLDLWTRQRVESSFYDDLRQVIRGCVPADDLQEGYTVTGLPSADSYPIDYFIRTPGRPLYLFGINGRDKARLTTIILQHLQTYSPGFESMVVCADIDDIPTPDRKRLMNAANDMVASIGDTDAITSKIAHRRAA